MWDLQQRVIIAGCYSFERAVLLRCRKPGKGIHWDIRWKSASCIPQPRVRL
jgi:hypothetical protein